MSRVVLVLAIALAACSFGPASAARIPATAQQADVDEDGQVSVLDLAIVAMNLGRTNAGRADVDGDGRVGMLDLVATADHFLETVPRTGGRDKLVQPFASNAIWNMPIGSGAQYAPLNFHPDLDYATVDEDAIVMSPGSPQRDLYLNGASGPGRCTPSTFTGVRVPVPDDYAIADASDRWTPNFAGAFLLTDGRTIVQTTATARCGAGAPVTAGFRAADVDIYGDGIAGGHGGSGMSSVGGSIRLGELIGGAPIRHVLKVNINCLRYCSQANGGHRWPAAHADQYALGPAGYGRRGFSVPGLGMGSLLALPPSVNIDAIGLETDAGRKLAWTLQNYGAYVVDDVYDPGGGWNVFAWDTEKGVPDEFAATTGLRLDTNAGPSYRDTVRIVTALAMIDNNGPSSVGGGGAPLQPLAPPIGN